MCASLSSPLRPFSIPVLPFISFLPCNAPTPFLPHAPPGYTLRLAGLEGGQRGGTAVPRPSCSSPSARPDSGGIRPPAGAGDGPGAGAGGVSWLAQLGLGGPPQARALHNRRQGAESAPPTPSPSRIFLLHLYPPAAAEKNPLLPPAAAVTCVAAQDTNKVAVRSKSYLAAVAEAEVAPAPSPPSRTHAPAATKLRAPRPRLRPAPV